MDNERHKVTANRRVESSLNDIFLLFRNFLICSEKVSAQEDAEDDSGNGSRSREERG